MKTIYGLMILSAMISGCTGSRYLLSDKGKDKRFLVNTIHESYKKDGISKKPMLVIDGLAYKYTDLKNHKLELSKNSIENIAILKNEAAARIYNKDAVAGVVLITTKQQPNKEPVSLDKSKILFLLEDKAISKDEMGKIDPKEIESIDVIKDKSTIKQYTTDDYDGVVIIHKKKKLDS